MSDGFMPFFFHQLAEKWKLDDKTFPKQSESISRRVGVTDKRRLRLKLSSAL